MKQGYPCPATVLFSWNFGMGRCIRLSDSNPVRDSYRKKLMKHSRSWRTVFLCGKGMALKPRWLVAVGSPLSQPGSACSEIAALNAGCLQHCVLETQQKEKDASLKSCRDFQSSAPYPRANNRQTGNDQLMS